MPDLVGTCPKDLLQWLHEYNEGFGWASIRQVDGYLSRRKQRGLPGSMELQMRLRRDGCSQRRKIAERPLSFMWLPRERAV